MLRAIILSIVVALTVCEHAVAKGPTNPAHLHGAGSAQGPIGWLQFCADWPDECKAPASMGGPMAMTTEAWRQLNSVNRYFNGAIKPVTDQEQYGVIEKWTYATSGKGDCEDYVLEKKRKLLQLGWSPGSLLITVVIDKQGGGHAVLTAITDKGDYVLDNVTDDILLWSESGLTFVKRQSTTNPSVWVDLGRTLGSPAFVATLK